MPLFPRETARRRSQALLPYRTVTVRLPAAVRIGEGPGDRDAKTAGHKPFLVLADLLTRKGMVILRYDKRGTAQSTGNSERATMEDLTGDAAAALTYLKARKEVDPK